MFIDSSECLFLEVNVVCVLGGGILAFIKNCLVREIVIKQMSFVNIFLNIFVIRNFSERSGFIKPFDVFHQSLGELLFDLSLLTIYHVRDFWFDFIHNKISVVFIVFMINYSTVFMINYSTCPFKFIIQYSFYISSYICNYFGPDCIILTILFGICFFDVLMICFVIFDV